MHGIVISEHLIQQGFFHTHVPVKSLRKSLMLPKIRVELGKHVRKESYHHEIHGRIFFESEEKRRTKNLRTALYL